MKMEHKFEALFQKWNTMSDSEFEGLLHDVGVEKVIPDSMASKIRSNDTKVANPLSLYKQYIRN